MSFELFVSFLVNFLLLILIYVFRKSLSVVHLFSISAFLLGMPFLRTLFGGEPWYARESVVVLSYFCVIIYSFSIVTFSFIVKDNSFYKTIFIVRNFFPSNKDLSVSIWIFVILWFLRLYRAYKYGIFFSGSATEEAVASVPYWLSVSSSIFSLLGGGALVIVILSSIKNRLNWLWLVIFIELLWFFSSGGRREFVFFLSIVLSILFFEKVIKAKVLLFLIPIFVSILVIVTPFFLQVRDYNSDYLLIGKSTVDSFSMAISDAYNDCGVGLGCIDRVFQNVSNRTNALEFLKLVVAAHQSGYDFLYGEGLLCSLAWAIPSFIVSKPSMMVEQLVQSRFGLVLIDDAISIPSLAYADAGIIGCIFAGVAIFIYIFFYFRASLRQKNTIIQFSMLYGIINILWNIEIDPTAYVVLVRDVFLIIFIYKTSRVFYRVKYKKFYVKNF